eukprot:7262641-Pyramimonas_sp.AAC.1
MVAIGITCFLRRLRNGPAGCNWYRSVGIDLRCGQTPPASSGRKRTFKQWRSTVQAKLTYPRGGKLRLLPHYFNWGPVLDQQ